MSNLRLKSNAVFWKSEHAESMLQVRSQVAPDLWDQAMVSLSDFRRTVAYDSYQWVPRSVVPPTDAEKMTDVFDRYDELISGVPPGNPQLARQLETEALMRRGALNIF